MAQAQESIPGSLCCCCCCWLLKRALVPLPLSSSLDSRFPFSFTKCFSFFLKKREEKKRGPRSTSDMAAPPSGHQSPAPSPLQKMRGEIKRERNLIARWPIIRQKNNVICWSSNARRRINCDVWRAALVGTRLFIQRSRAGTGRERERPCLYLSTIFPRGWWWLDATQYRQSGLLTLSRPNLVKQNVFSWALGVCRSLAPAPLPPPPNPVKLSPVFHATPSS